MKAKDIEAALQQRHKSDVFVTELSTAKSHLRLDAWAMPRSWSRWTTIGYEIKVSRGDFLRDQKWQGYLDYCHEFYFVVPWGMVDPKEIGDGAGLMYVTKNGKTRVKSAAPRRQIDFPEGLFKRLVMNATGFSAPWRDDRPQASDVDLRAERIIQFARHINCANDGRDLAKVVRGSIRQELISAEARASKAEAGLASLEGLRQGLLEVGIDEHDIVNGRWARSRVIGKVKTIARGLDPELARTMRTVSTHLANIADEISE